MKKRAITISLAIAFIATMFSVNPFVVNAKDLADGTVYTFGDGALTTVGKYPDSTLKQSTTTQGVNGWSYMYTTQTNVVGGAYDRSKFTLESVYNKNTATGASNFWLPFDDAAYATDVVVWKQSSSGIMSPSYGTTSPTSVNFPASAVTSFVAPKTGTYSFSMQLKAGANNPTIPDSSCDGMYLSALTGNKTIWAVDTKALIVNDTYCTTYSDNFTVLLKAGDPIYFVVDPKTNGIYDYAKINVSATIVQAGTDYTDGDHFFTGGDSATMKALLSNNQDGTTQGINGWYFMSAPQTNAAGIIDTTKIVENTTPGPDSSAATAFKAPKTGTYLFNVDFSAGTIDSKLPDPNADGEYLSVNTETATVWEKDVGRNSVQDYTADVTVMLQKDQYIYFVADPKVNSTGDSAKVTVVGTYVGSAYTDNSSTYYFGTAATDAAKTLGITPNSLIPNGSQGGFRFMYTPQFNIANGAYDVSKIADDVFAFSETFGQNMWYPAIYAGGYNSWYSGLCNLWYQKADGSNIPEIGTAIENPNPSADDNMLASAVIGFQAPASGVYSVSFNAWAGTGDKTYQSSDGVTVSVLTAKKTLFTQVADITANAPGYSNGDPANVAFQTDSVALKKGEYVYFVTDPNGNGAKDLSQYGITIHYVSSIPATGDNSVPVIMTIMFIAVAGLTFIAVKKYPKTKKENR